MKTNTAFILSSCLILPTIQSCKEKKEVQDDRNPNIVIIYADDLGYADVGCYGAKGVSTPNIDRLAAEGLQFTDAHCAAATCTPSRYSLLTGSYAFRNEAAILPGDAPLIISPDKLTLPGLLQRKGYATAVIGKWHLGLGDGTINWNKEIRPGPLEIGFDYSFLIPATGDRVPCVFVENHHVVGLDPDDPISVDYQVKVGNDPTGEEFPELLKMKADPQHSKTIVDSVSRIGYMSGGDSARWKDEEFPFVLSRKAKDFMTEHKDKPFFLYFSFHDIHVPRIPNKRFVGKSTMGPRGDAIAQMDWVTGELLKQLEELGLSENTLIIFSSDNGPVLDDGYDDRAVELVGDHKPSGPFRGGKYSAYEAGTRVPTIAYWPGVINPGKSNALISQVDLMASIASLVGYTLFPKDAPDSYELLDCWLGKSRDGRDFLLEESFTFSLRNKNWKYILPGEKSPDWLKNKDVESGLMQEDQLFNIEEDIDESSNLATGMEEKNAEMKKKLLEILANPTRK